MRLVIASDHAGLELKQHLFSFLTGLNFDVTDPGTHTTPPADYPDFAEAVGRAIVSGAAERAILICGSGVGASVAANKLKGIRAGLCHDSYSARQGVEHDDMNVLVLGQRVVSPALAKDLVRFFPAAQFTGEARHVRRLHKGRGWRNGRKAMGAIGAGGHGVISARYFITFKPPHHHDCAASPATHKWRG